MKRKGIESIVAVMFLVIGTVILGGLLWAFASPLFAGQTKIASVSVTGQLIEAKGVVTVRNTGTMNITITEIRIKYDDTTVSTPSIPSPKIAPGISKSYDADPTTPYVAGRTYTVIVRFEDVDGKPHTEIVKVVAS